MRVIYRYRYQTSGEFLNVEVTESASTTVTWGDIDLENAQLSAVNIICREVHSNMLVQ
jgi:hypothetical protein